MESASRSKLACSVRRNEIALKMIRWKVIGGRMSRLRCTINEDVLRVRKRLENKKKRRRRGEGEGERQEEEEEEDGAGTEDG